MGHRQPEWVSPNARRYEAKDALRPSWAQALAFDVDLRVDLDQVFVGHRVVTITYQGVGGRRVAETLELGTDDQVIRAHAAYAGPSPST